MGHEEASPHHHPGPSLPRSLRGRYCKQKGVPFYKMELPSIIVSYANEGARTKIDELKKVKFSKRNNKAAQGDKSLTVDVDMKIVGGVYQDGVAPV